MKRKQKLYAVLAIFLMFAVAAFVFILSDSNEDKLKIKNPVLENNPKIPVAPAQNENGQTERIKTVKKEEAEKIYWQPVIDKWKGKEFSRMRTEKKIIALTFDTGGTGDGVDEILEILKKENVKSTIFLTGRFMEKYPDKTRKIIDSGADLGNHTYSHPHFVQLNLSQDKIDQELEKTEKLLAGLDAKFLPLFRFPYGERNKQNIGHINDKNYISIRWSDDSLGWKGLSGGMSKDSVRDRVLKQAVPGAIILMHLGSNPDDGTNLDSEALPEIISELKAQRYEFMTISEMLTSVLN